MSTDHDAASTKTPVPLLDLGRENAPLLDEIRQAHDEIMQSGWFVLGPHVQKLEDSIAKLCGTKHAIGCASGSDALLLALMAAGVEQGDEVIVPSFTFFATASCVTRLGAVPVFADIDPGTFNISVDRIAECITPQTKAIIPVHLFGQCADMDAINALAKQHGLTVIEDAAQAIGARYHDRPAGSLGDMACYSFYPTKNLGGFGDGGMLTTNNDELAARLKLLRVHGMQPRYHHGVVGINSRLDAMQAAVLNVKLTHLADWTRQRQENAKLYGQLFAAAGLDDILSLPTVPSGYHPVWNQFTIRVSGTQRDSLRKSLGEAKIGTEIYYPIPLHRQECFAYLNVDEAALPETNRAAEEVLSLPIFPALTAEEQQRVVEEIGSYFAGQATVRQIPQPHFLSASEAASDMHRNTVS